MGEITEALLLVGKIAFLVLLYLFIFNVVRSSTRDLRFAAPAAPDKRWRMPGASPEDEEADLANATALANESGMWTLIVVRSPTIPAGAAYALPAESRALAGRSSDMDILLDDTFVSAKHAMFEVTGGALWLEDLRSTNGTVVNGRKISEVTGLSLGDKVTIGDTTFEVRVR